MQLNGYECGMLDALLETLSATGCLTAAQLTELFDGDNEQALFLLDILTPEKFILEIGYAQGSQLPLLLSLENKGRRFLENGGFTAIYEREQPKAPGTWERISAAAKRMFKQTKAPLVFQAACGKN